MQIPDGEHSIVELINKHYESKQDAPRPHMGVSQIGNPCERALWYSFRWVAPEKFNGRILRLFRRGQLEEATVVEDLRSIGCNVTNTAEHQSRVDFGCHVSGSCDGIIRGGHGLGQKPHVLEIKTHGEKSFRLLVKDGVKKAKPLHWAQMQCYMLGMDMERALYYAVNKNTDDVYTERLELDKDAAQRLVARAQDIVTSERIPPPISEDASWYECKMCAYHAQCHTKAPTTSVSCRTCAHSTPEPDSTWSCELHQAGGIPVEFQRTGCDSHVLHPDMVPWPIDSDASTEFAAVYLVNGKPVKNGKVGPGVYASAEILANPEACASWDEYVLEMRAEFGAVVVG